ncbi:MAG: MFS transporter [Hyphomonadaceae bacterium]|nr:MFS transporter [Hyphomonadaceae bacterium]
MTSLRAIASLIVAITILQAAQGLMGVQLPLAMHADGLKGAAIGFVGAMYSAGFMAGAWFGPTMLARVGHIRVFAASASVVTASTLMLFMAADPISWALLRGVMGGAIALVFVAVDSWMSASVRKEERGGAMGVYQVLTKAALTLGPFLAFGAPMDGAAPLMIAGALMAMAVVPITLTTQPQPDPPRAQPLALRDQFNVAPAAVTAAFFAGFINAGVMTLAPLYAEEHFGAASAASFQSSAWLGSLLLQWPAGKLSDRIDRRLVMAGLAALAAASALALAVIGGSLPFAASAALFALWGAGGLSFYGIATAHMADRAEPGRIAQAASGLLFVWATGSIVGPLLLGVAVEAAGRSAMFWFAGLSAAGLAAFMLHRRGEREPSLQTSKEAVAPQQATSVAAAEIAYGDNAPGAAAEAPAR